MSNIGEVVTSVGNSWIICRSKSYVGRIYYFNTATGEAAWNLSEIEVEKAKKRTQSLQCQPGFTMDNCPEPLETPAELEKQPVYKYSNSQHLRVTPKVYNKQIINNQFSKPPDLYSSAVIQCSPMNTSPFNIPIASALNTSIWTVAPPQIFVTPSVSQSQPYNTYDLECVPVTNTSLTLTNRFKKIAEVHHRYPALTQDILKNDKCEQKLKIDVGPNKNDLRLFLSLKRAENILKNTETHQIDCKGPIPLYDQYNDAKITSFNINEDDGCFEEHFQSQDHTQEIEINSLRNFLQVKDHTVLYIVTDCNVLLNSVCFLNNLLRDNQSRLVVPRTVMNKIQDATNSRLRTYAHRAAYFVLQQVDENLAIIDETTEVSERNNDDIKNCCIKLINLGKCVVLLTDDIELHNSENASNVAVLSVKEIKRLVGTYKSDKISSQKTDVVPLAQNRSIKITINNDVNIDDENEQVVSTSTEKCLDPETSADEKRVGQVLDGNFEVNKKVHDVGIQTESFDVDTPINTSNNNNSVNATKFKDSNNVSDRPCGIQLKRHLSHDTLKMKNTGRKKLVWRRRNTKSSLTLDDDSAKAKNDVVSECTTTDLRKSAMASPACGNLTLGISSLSTESWYKQDLNNYDGDSETSSFINKAVKPHGNIIIEETSSLTSGMSCNLSVAESVSILKGVQLNEQKMQDDKNVMFEVTDSKMEEYLRMKSDEWVSRFVQIMEEALTQVLHQDPPFVLDSMPPPWTIHEAAECVRQKFHADSDIVDAATKLLNISFENGGFRGKIKSNITPCKYMELYSYGVYLVDALQGLLSNNEDLQTASESLSKLLSDIQDPHLDPSNQDSFVDSVTHENEVNIDGNDTSNIVDDSESNCKEMQNMMLSDEKRKTVPKSPTKYNLRSVRKKLLQEDNEICNKDVHNTDRECSFFSNLDLRKNICANVANTTTDSTKSEDGFETNDEEKPDLRNIGGDTIASGETTSRADNDVTKPIGEPKIIRNFVKCAEYEEKVKNKLSRYDYDFYKDPHIDYESYDEEYSENSYYVNDTSSQACIENTILFKNLDKVLENDDITFRLVIGKLEAVIKEVYSSIEEFCIKCYRTLQSPDINKVDKSEIQERGTEIYTYIGNICNELNSISSREKTSQNIFTLLNRKEFEDVKVTEEDINDYRNFIVNCLKQGNILKETIALILEASKS